MADFKSKPDAGMYGVFGTAAAQSMGANPYGQIGLLKMAQNQQAQYQDQLAKAQQMEYLLAQDANRADIAKQEIASAGVNTKAGVGNDYHDVENPYLTGFDRDRVAQANAVGIDSTVAATAKDRAAAIKDIEAATGSAPEVGALPYIVGGSLYDGGPNYFHNLAKSGNAIDQMKAEAALGQASAAQTRAAKYTGGGDGGGSGGDTITEETTDFAPDGTAMGRHVKVKTKGGHAQPAGQGGGSDGKVTIKYKRDGRTVSVMPVTADKAIKAGIAEKVH